MPKKLFKSNPRIEITPEDTVFIISRSHEEKMRELESMVTDIIRHIDGVDSRGRNISVTEDITNVCEFCGSVWTEESKMYNGGCCYKDIEYESMEITD